jgi:signal transduction histidine kinase
MRMRLSSFIAGNIEPILVEWDDFARSLKPGEAMNALALRDHADEILLATVEDMRLSRNAVEGSVGSQGRNRVDESLHGASERHAIGRLGSGFELDELVSEYRALRASVLRLWHESGPEPHDSDVDDVTRFNESIDQSLAKAVSSYTKRIDQSRDLFLAILSHDLRNPLNSIAMSAALLPHLVHAATEAVNVASQISTDANVMLRMISDLLDYTRTRLGAGMPVKPSPMDLGALCQELHSEFRSAHPNRQIELQTEGDLSGRWDADRLRQAVSNLLGNAIQHSPESAAVQLSLQGGTFDVVLVVSNGGPPIPPGELSKIFDPLVRGSSAEHPKVNRPGSIGLGLYIARAIVESHGGTVAVTSSFSNGTHFTVCLPREYVTHTRQPILDEEHLHTM